jgi:hypothetical protein
MNNTKALPIRKWMVSLEDIADEAAALDGWRLLIRAQGWSPVGEPQVISNPQFGEYAVVGRVVQYPGLTVAETVTGSICVPA